jgi:protein-S-isoprenylcysteine O-methyltransferase Ste14
MFRPHPISFLQFGIFWAVVAVGAVALIRAFAGSRERGESAKKSNLSRAGVALQTIGFLAIGLGPIHVALPWSAPSSIICSALTALFGGSAIAIFIAATRAMGKNWSVVARMRSDHELIRTGPFAVVRHPIYLALFLYMLSFGIAFGHFGQLALAVPLYAIGATIRIREEERLLRAQFGEDHARYVREVPAFIPFIG